ncbi:DNA-formamidopyrimidine glycosylase [Candidatus Roizmanbacteria bacterium RIFCSPHIGHO2_02_FULL_37_13b]|uniref:DNA-formamidopyrimidine glycosylase n=1 Tax=Candidatus Roizmanbacteria bacterium RIFCSPLOWO2_02_FULL_36_11 TaxID=1802071 RepID=A0A1F7JI80_9BACT|nr:MAG: DNA-formamidopyrimidine glycosylase [Candidatus Roizmanbacteria bacterium RIFCSPHIGHO2_02_FULL_37_13b]OGK55307.1 MAG: DNA-formamidopyrimidine glycosylase [Candidatus Roizmanbacteria bacterium RIFCSPLOWO2_02_FULL_36_11]
MPELPEIETIRLALNKKIIGKKITGIEILFKKQFIGDKENILGQKIIKLLRAGKVLSIKLSNGKYLNFHLKLSGQIMYAEDIHRANYKYPISLTGGATKLPASSTRVIIRFSDKSGLFFNESRKFGWVKVTDKQEIQKGLDILSPDFTLDYFRKKLNSNRQIKVILMDQDRFAGIGNIYANESLFDANISPEISASKLAIEQSNHLFKSIVNVIKHAIKHNGSSGKDNVYILPDGSAGEYQYHFLVYQQEGKPCIRCKTLIKRIKQARRSSYYCPKCQK